MFIENRYKRIHDAICERARNRSVTGYVERHHIIPKSLGGSNSKENLVLLTAREHYIAHLCLVRCTSGTHRYKMICAVNYLIDNRKCDVRFNGRLFAKLREARAVEMSKSLMGHAPTHTQPHSIVVRERISRGMMGNKNSPGWPKGKPRKSVMITA